MRLQQTICTCSLVFYASAMIKNLPFNTEKKRNDLQQRNWAINFLKKHYQVRLQFSKKSVTIAIRWPNSMTIIPLDCRYYSHLIVKISDYSYWIAKIRYHSHWIASHATYLCEKLVKSCVNLSPPSHNSLLEDLKRARKVQNSCFLVAISQKYSDVVF